MAEASEGVVMGETVAEIREWHRDRSVTDDTAVFYYQWIGTLLAEIERLEARRKLTERMVERLIQTLVQVHCGPRRYCNPDSNCGVCPLLREAGSLLRAGKEE